MYTLKMAGKYFARRLAFYNSDLMSLTTLGVAVDRIRCTTLTASSQASTAVSLRVLRRLEDDRDEGTVDQGNYFWTREMRWR